MTLTNGNGPTQTLDYINLTNGWIWQTYGGSCYTVSNVLPHNSSCTIEFGYAPQVPNVSATANATIYFTSGVQLSLELDGPATYVVLG